MISRTNCKYNFDACLFVGLIDLKRLAFLSTILGVDREVPCPAKCRGFPKALGYILRKTKGIQRPFFRPL